MATFNGSVEYLTDTFSAQEDENVYSLAFCRKCVSTSGVEFTLPFLYSLGRNNERQFSQQLLFSSSSQMSSRSNSET